jgi:polysaccharide export outer membrane protein
MNNTTTITAGFHAGTEFQLPEYNAPLCQQTKRRGIAPRSLLIVAIAGITALTGCDTVPTGPPLPASATLTSSPTVIGEGDMLKFFFPGAPEYNSVQKVRPDGKLTLPLVGEVSATGKSLRGFQSELSSRYRSQLQNPEVVVSLEASGNPVTITGAVNGPGKFSYDKPTTLFEAIMGAGGFNEFAKRRSVKIIRIVNNQYQVGTYDMSGSAIGRLPLVYVKPGDVIYVSD